eukprot:maker-scaffold_13-augustus-gene-5.52-mRNA-1 protein AED:0.00 eAED:0.00 QI:115/1/1/1/1/1/2/39/488
MKSEEESTCPFSRLSRLGQISSHLSSVSSNPTHGNNLPLPPIVTLPPKVLFPTYPEVLKDSKKNGLVFTYLLQRNKRMTFLCDQKTYKHVFFAKDSDDVDLDSAKLAYHWFGIEKSLAYKFTRPSLDRTREAMRYGKMLYANEDVGKHIEKTLSSFPKKGEGNLWDIAMLTFEPVIKHIFGEKTFSGVDVNWLANELWSYDEDFRKVANGIPRKYFPKMEVHAGKICKFFKDAIENGDHEMSDEERLKANVLQMRLSVIEEYEKGEGAERKYTPEEKARFMFSVFWASQGNTIPGTFWMLALIASNPGVQDKLREELKNGNKARLEGKLPFHFDESNFPYLNACLKETLRKKVANVTLRSVRNDLEVKTTAGKEFKVPKGDEITVSSYVQHHDENVYPNPEKFMPERWLDGKLSESKEFIWFPFGAGTNQCSGRHLAQLELATVAGLFFSRFRVRVLENLPEEKWKNCVAMVGPKTRELKYSFEYAPV